MTAGRRRTRSLRTAWRAAATSAALASMTMLAAGIAAAAPDPFFPTHGDDGIDVQHYDLRLRVGDRPTALAARARLRVRSTRALDRFALDLHGLAVRSVRIDGAVAAFEQRDDKLLITLPEPVARGRLFTATVRYAGDVDPLPDPVIAPETGGQLGWRSHRDAAFVVSEPVGASTWFPANDTPADRATFSIAVEVPRDVVAAANGRLVGIDEFGARRRYRYAMDEPMTAWAATVNVNRFVVDRSTSSNGIPVTVYASPTTSAAAVRGYRVAKDALPWFAARFGPYPYAGYGSVAVADPTLGFALETQSLSIFPEYWHTEAVVAHELAHQWFGNSVAIRGWRDLWLAEGFATYAELLWPRRSDPAAFDAVMRALHARVLARRIGPAVVSRPASMFSARTYQRGATVLYALHLRIGQPQLFAILRDWTTRQRGRTVTTRGFVDTVVRVTGDESLREFLRTWIYDPVVPAVLPGRPSTQTVPADAAGDAQLEAQLEAQLQAQLDALVGARHRRP